MRFAVGRPGNRLATCPLTVCLAQSVPVSLCNVILAAMQTVAPHFVTDGPYCRRMSLLELFALGAPSCCAGCRRLGSPLCRKCRDGLGRPNVPKVPGVDQVLVGFPYQGAARSLVLDLKLRGDRGAALPLTEALIRGVAAVGLTAEVVTWIPGRTHENRRRGLDHAGILAAQVGRGLGLPIRPLLNHTSERPDQASLHAAERWANLEGAFVARDCPERVALVDDLVTTGATAAAGARALRDAGAVRVEVLAACSA